VLKEIKVTTDLEGLEGLEELLAIKVQLVLKEM
jgi:hypothetical protein